MSDFVDQPLPLEGVGKPAGTHGAELLWNVDVATAAATSWAMLGFALLGAKDGVGFVAAEARAEARELLRSHRPTGPWQPLPLVLATATAHVPLVIWVYGWGVSELRYTDPLRAFLVGLGVVFATVVVGAALAKERVKEAKPVRLLVAGLFGSVCAAFAAGVLAERNFVWHEFSSDRYDDLAAYVNIDPAVDLGQTYMDAGQVYFKEGSRVATEAVAAFKSGGTFCAAPIVGPTGVPMGSAAGMRLSVDFWAVGVDCCDPARRKFSCGGGPRARAGLRLLRDDTRQFFALAVQQWEASMCGGGNTAPALAAASPLLCPKARHPLFFHWVEDPLLEIDRSREMGSRLFGRDVLMLGIMGAALTLASSWGLFYLGFK